VVPGNGGVERDNSQPVQVVHAVLGCFAAGNIEEQARILQSFIMISHDPDHFGAQPLGDRFDDRPKAYVCVGLSQVREVASKDDRLRLDSGLFELRESAREIYLCGDRAVQRFTTAQEVSVTDMRNYVRRRWVLPELNHHARLRRGRDRRPALFSPDANRFDNQNMKVILRKIVL